MKIVIQRVTQASVKVGEQTTGQIGLGLLVLCGFVDDDTSDDLDWITKKICNLRIFDDENGVMNKSLIDVDGELLVVSQFTLHALTKKGNRPSYIRSAKAELANSLYVLFKQKLNETVSKPIQTGKFGADMLVSLQNTGPVTIIIDSKKRE